MRDLAETNTVPTAGIEVNEARTGKAWRVISAPPKVADWEGRQVMCIYPLENGMGTIEAYRALTITSSGITKHLRTETCECCSVSMRIRIQAPKDKFLKRFFFVEEAER
ncbi:hypothetical protein [Nitratifractor sp.]